jgi:hypothetical protein
MFRCLCLSTTLLALALFAGPPPAPAAGQKVDHPRLRAALHELREARTVLKDAKDVWPPGYKEQALRSLNDAIATVRTILAVKDVDNFRGVDRNPDYYRRYKDHPRLRAALDDIRDARDELRSARAEFAGLKDQALDDLDVAAGSIVMLIRHGKR